MVLVVVECLCVSSRPVEKNGVEVCGRKEGLVRPSFVDFMNKAFVSPPLPLVS